MRKKYLPFIAIAIMTFFVACSNEDLITEENTEPQVEGRTISLTASMPDEEPVTRVALGQEGKDINLTWVVYNQATQSGDRIDLVFVQGTTMQRVIANVDSTSNYGKTAHFNIPIPSGATGTLYGVHGGRGTDPNEATRNHALLPTNPGSTSTLASLQADPADRKMMLYFKHEVEATDTTVSVSFKHLGSLFAISFNNTEAPSPSSGITGARLVGVNASGGVLTNGNWAFNNGAGGQVFNLLTEQFQDITTAGNYISFSTAGTTWNVGQTTTLWAWYPPIPNQTWPALRLVMTDVNGDEVISTDNFKPAKTSAPEAGKVYHFYARWDGSALNFTNDQFDVSPAN